MSEGAADRPGDWRRRRRSSGTGPAPPGAGSGGQDTETPEEEQEPELSRTVFSFLEPGIDAIGSFGPAIVIAGIFGLVSGISMVAFVGSLRPYGITNIIIGVALIGLVTLISLSSVVAAFFGRTGKYGVNTVIMLAAFTGIMVVVNFISFENHRRMDVTATNQFSLANRTKQLLKELPEPVHATAFYKDNIRSGGTGSDSERVLQRLTRKAKVQETLEEFAARSNKFSYDIVDPDLKPVIASKYFRTLPSGFVEESVVVEGQDFSLFDVVHPTDTAYSEFEQDLVTGILVATGREKKTVYFLAGHGERGIANTQGDGYSALKRGLELENYDVRILAWDPAEDNVSVPADPVLENCSLENEDCLPEAALVVVARPSGELPLAHAEALNLYLQGMMKDPNNPENLIPRRESGRMIFLAEPDTKDSFRGFLLQWGVIVDSRHIRDLDRSVPDDPFTIRVSTFNPNAPPEIIIPQGERLDTVFMPGATALGLAIDDSGVSVPLLGTSNNSFLIDDVDRTEPIINAGDGSDVKGTFSPAVLIRTIDLVVFGDSDFVANSYYGRGSGADLFLNSANYLMGDYSLVSIREKGFAFREFNLNKNERKFVEWSSWVMLPGLLALMAGLIWWVRR